MYLETFGSVDLSEGGVKLGICNRCQTRFIEVVSNRDNKVEGVTNPSHCCSNLRLVIFTVSAPVTHLRMSTFRHDVQRNMHAFTN